MQVSKVFFVSMIIITMEKNVMAYEQILSFDYLKCGIYQLKGKIVKKDRNDSSSYFFQIFPDKGSRRYSKSRLINLKHTDLKQLSRFETYSDLSITIQGKYHKDSNKKNYITFNQIIGPSTYSDLYDPHKVITKIQETQCD